MNEIEHIPKCPKNGEVNLLYLIEIIKSNMEFLEKDLEDIIWEAYQSEYGIFRERFRGHYLGSIPK